MKKIIKYILILIILAIFIILNFYKSNKKIFEDIMIFGLWEDNGAKNEYEITLDKTVKIDVFTTINNKMYKKIAPGSKGSFIIKFQKPIDSSYKIKINEKTSKPKNLLFIFEGKKYSSMKQMEDIINEKFIDTDKITINWEWKYYTDEINDIQDTRDGKNAQKYFFEIESIVEEQERNEI